MTAPPLFSDAYLLGRWDAEFQQYQENGDDDRLLAKLKRWAARTESDERKVEASFVTTFFEEIWGYEQPGRASGPGHSCQQQFSIPNAGAGGGPGAADLGLGFFGLGGTDVPQGVCEFKDIRSALDAPQKRRGSTRSPVEQAIDYLVEAGRAHRGAAVEPAWAIVTDMNEFRLYTREPRSSASQRFVIERKRLEPVVLLDNTPEAQLQRFLFSRVFHREWLLASAGVPPLLALWREQGLHERKIEEGFYAEYHAYREYVFETIVEANPKFNETKGKLVRLTQRFLDRCLFVFFCEDMGARLKFPQHLLRDLLRERANPKFYDADSSSIWSQVKDLFRAMREGTKFGAHQINRFNGGLFAEDPELDRLEIPNRLFCVPEQFDPKQAHANKLTLLFFSAVYYYGEASPKGEKALSLYALGRIFEQSITDLEYMEAKAEGRPSITELSKRKRDGVYYTPEWVTEYLVEQTLGAHLAAIRESFGLDRPAKDKDRRVQLDKYEAAIREVKVLDPACGSGAFLIQAMGSLVRAHDWIAREREHLGVRTKGKEGTAQKAKTRGQGTLSLFDNERVVREILSRNIYGVDINSESVAITRLALWLHTTAPGRPLTDLDHNIRSGNTLVSRDFYLWSQQSLAFSDEEQERINVFDFAKEFPEVFSRERPGFDLIIGNPPYVKLQNLKKVESDVATYLKKRETKKGVPLYESTQTGNFDLYLPFIERGIELLAPDGRMGFIAPNIWMKAEYGVGLKKMVHAGGHLERWIDFKHYQVFDEAITYTALQFFTRAKNDKIRVVIAPNGQEDLPAIEWSSADAIPYSELDPEGIWVIASKADRDLLQKLDQKSEPLGNTPIIVGVQTTLNDVYHLDRIDSGRYRHKTRGEVAIEDGIMRPLVGAEEARRYEEPRATCYVLFPYDDSARTARLFTEAEMTSKFPIAWKYLRSFETELRKGHPQPKNKAPRNLDDKWWGYAYPKNIEKQGESKLCVAQTVPEMRVCYDDGGKLVLDNVRVNGILPGNDERAWFLLAVLNGDVTNYAFKLIGKPKEGGFYEANKQFIAPLPIPKAKPADQKTIAAHARELQRLHTERRDAIADLDERLSACRVAWRPLTWIWPDVDEKKAAQPKKATWASGAVRPKLGALGQQLASRRGHLGVKLGSGAIAVEAGGVQLLRAYVTPAEAPLVAVQWRQAVRRFGDEIDADAPSKFVEGFIELRDTSNTVVAKQIEDLDATIAKLDGEIAVADADAERAMEPLYNLTPGEKALVAKAQ